MLRKFISYQQPGQLLLTSVLIMVAVTGSILTVTGYLRQQSVVNQQLREYFLAQAMANLADEETADYNWGHVQVKADKTVVTLNNQHQYQFVVQ